MRDAVRRGVVHREIDRDPLRVESQEDLAQVVRDAADVGHDLGVVAVRLDVRLVEAADDRDAIAAPREDERGVPGDVRAHDEVERGVVHRGALAREEQPGVQSQLVEDLRDLLDLLADQGIADAHRVTSWRAC